MVDFLFLYYYTNHLVGLDIPVSEAKYQNSL